MRIEPLRLRFSAHPVKSSGRVVRALPLKQYLLPIDLGRRGAYNDRTSCNHRQEVSMDITREVAALS
jgi:hypothetical protein